MKRVNCAAAALALLGAVLAAPSMVLADQEQTIKAFAAWQGRGQMYETGINSATFVGSFSGMIFVETDKGPLHHLGEGRVARLW